MNSSPIVAPSSPESSHSSAPTFSRLLKRLQPTSGTLFLVLSVLIGVGVGSGIVLFNFLIEVTHHLTLELLMGAIAPLGPWTLACVPLLGGTIVGLMRWRWQDFGPSIPSIVAAVKGFSELSPLKPVVRMVAAAVSLGTGASLGPEGPSVEIGGDFGTLLGQALQVSQERQYLLLAAGAAAGFAAGLNAPIAGVFFALEVILGTAFASSAVSAILLAAVLAAWISQIGLGGRTVFELPIYEVRSALELPLYLGLGLLASLLSITFVKTIRFFQASFSGQVTPLIWLGRIPKSLRPVLGAACIGVAALKFPQILGVGYGTIEAVLRDVEFSLVLLIGLVVVKLIMTAISLGSGLVGGIYAPALFLGASLGAAYGKVLAILFPMLPIAAPPAYAMVGMAAVLAGTVRAPLTAILLLFELTHDYRIVLPLMAAVGLTIWIVEGLQPLAKGANSQPMGLNLPTDQKRQVLQQVKVLDAMRPHCLQLPASCLVVEAGYKLIAANVRGALVVDQSETVMGVVTLLDIDRAIQRWQTLQCDLQNLTMSLPESMVDLASDDRPNPLALPIATGLTQQTLQDICTTDVVYAEGDEPVAAALDRMTSLGLHQLPVIQRGETSQVVGWLDQDAIELAFSLAMTRQTLATLAAETTGRALSNPR